MMLDVKEFKHALIFLLGACSFTADAQFFPGREFLVEINNIDGSWKKIGSPISGIGWVGTNIRAFDEKHGVFIFPAANEDFTINWLKSVRSTDGSVLNNPPNHLYFELQFDDDSGNLYGIQGSSFVSIDATTGNSTSIRNSLPISGVSQGYSTFDQLHRTFYLLASPGYNLLSIDIITGNVIVNSFLNIAFGDFLLATAFDNTSSTMYGLLSTEQKYFLVRIDPATGSVQKVGIGTDNGSRVEGTSATIDEENHTIIYIYSATGAYTGTGQTGEIYIVTMDLNTGEVLHKAKMEPTPETTYNNFYSLKYSNTQRKIFGIHFEKPLISNPTPKSPTITNVTVDFTDSITGQITVKWRSPYGGSLPDYPPPYTYTINRAEGTDPNNLVPIGTTANSDTVFKDTGLNTMYPHSYRYQVTAYAGNGAPVGNSALSSTVVLKTRFVDNNIRLTWSAEVPWSNFTQRDRYHLIFRGEHPGATKISDLILIDSVDVRQTGKFAYTDSGQFNHTPLSGSLRHYYAVMTRGAYNDARVPAPLVNFSEINLTIPPDDVPPCAPQLAMVPMNCDAYIGCSPPPPTVSNIIRWNNPSTAAGCNIYIKYFNVYASPPSQQLYTLIAKVANDTSYVHSNLPSVEMCYKISAVDFFGRESMLSDSFCFENCPNYVLPNVFSPNGDGCNDFFSAYSVRESDMSGSVLCEQTDAQKAVLAQNCARFVEDVSFKVYNRWGKVIYSYQSADANSIYIDWNGKDDDGNDLVAGTYYYLARIKVQVADPAKQERTLKGWVTLVR